MPLGPETIKNKHINSLVEIIDIAITNSVRIPVRINTDRLPGIESCMDRILSFYTKVGWNKVDIVYDQRDGNYLELS